MEMIEKIYKRLKQSPIALYAAIFGYVETIMILLALISDRQSAFPLTNTSWVSTVIILENIAVIGIALIGGVVEAVAKIKFDQKFFEENTFYGIALIIGHLLLLWPYAYYFLRL